MIEVYERLFVTDERADRMDSQPIHNVSMIHACKDPCHRKLLGYVSRGAPLDHPEYFYAQRDHALYLNLVDADNPSYIPPRIIEKALTFCDGELARGNTLILHCNSGVSRAPSIALMYLVRFTQEVDRESPERAIAQFRDTYPLYDPAGGMKGFLTTHWDQLVGGEELT